MHLALTFALLLSALRPLFGAQAAPIDEADERRAIVLVTFEAVRPDWTGRGGWPRPTTPRLDALGAEGLSLARAVTPIPAAAGAHASLFTGMEARAHGLSSFVAPKAGWKPAEGVRTAAELLSAELYRCAAIVSHAGVGKATGIPRGFASVDEPTEGTREAAEVAARAERWLEVHGDSRYFLWIHLKGGLEPNRPSTEALERFPRAPELQARLDGLGVAPERFNLGFPKPLLVRLFFPELDAPTIHPQFQVPTIDGERFLQLFARYEADLRATDDALGRVLDALARRPVGQRAVVVVAGAYGQSLGERTELGHGECTPEGLFVPAVVRAPGLAPRRLELTVSTRDLLPTALRLAGARSADKLLAQGGQDLLGQPVDGAFATRPDREFERNPPGPVHVLYTNRWRYVHRPTRTDLLYDLQSDPQEVTNVIAQHPQEAAALLEAVRARLL